MAASDDWEHIADHAWELHTLGTHYTVHQENNQWVARKFAVSSNGDANKEAEESAPSLEVAKRIVDRWESQRKS